MQQSGTFFMLNVTASFSTASQFFVHTFLFLCRAICTMSSKVTVMRMGDQSCRLYLISKCFKCFNCPHLSVKTAKRHQVQIRRRPFFIVRWPRLFWLARLIVFPPGRKGSSGGGGDYLSPRMCGGRANITGRKKTTKERFWWTPEKNYTLLYYKTNCTWGSIIFLNSRK